MKQLIQLEQTLPNNERLPSSFPAVLFPKNEVAIRKLPPQLSSPSTRRTPKRKRQVHPFPLAKNRYGMLHASVAAPVGFSSICLLPFVFPSKEIADDLNSGASQVQNRDKHLPACLPATRLFFPLFPSAA